MLLNLRPTLNPLLSGSLPIRIGEAGAPQFHSEEADIVGKEHDQIIRRGVAMAITVFLLGLACRNHRRFEDDLNKR